MLLRQLAALEHLLRLDQTVRLRIDLRAVALRHAPSDHFLLSSLHLAEVGIVIETVLQGGSDAQVHAVQILHRLTEDVSAAVPEGLPSSPPPTTHRLSSLIVELQDPQLAVALQNTVHIPEKSLLLLLIALVLLGVARSATQRGILINNLFTHIDSVSPLSPPAHAEPDPWRYPLQSCKE